MFVRVVVVCGNRGVSVGRLEAAFVRNESVEGVSAGGSGAMRFWVGKCRQRQPCLLVARCTHLGVHAQDRHGQLEGRDDGLCSSQHLNTDVAPVVVECSLQGTCGCY